MPDFTDASYFPGHADELFTPRDEAELLEILHRANSQHIPVTFQGALTGVTAAAVPLGGWAISLVRLNKIEIQPGKAIVGPGAALRDVQCAAEQSKQFYAPDPTENTSSIGGNIAANASGSHSYRFGATRDHVLALRVALINGEILEIRRGRKVAFDVLPIRLPQTTKLSAGYRLSPGMDLIDLVIGSEGTLGVITQAELNLLPPRGELLSGVVFFKSEEAAFDAVERWRSANLNMIEYLDRASLEMLDVPHAAALMIEQEGDGDLDMTGALESESWFAVSAADRERFRLFRHALPERCNERIRRSGFTKLSTDYAVPLLKTRQMMSIYRKMLVPPYVIFGHIGDAHLHINTFPSNKEEHARAKAVLDDLARPVVELGGTVGAEHGLGKRKAHLLRLQYKPDSIEAMRTVKRRFDPDWLLGQGTLFAR